MGEHKAKEGLHVSDRGLCEYLYSSSMSHGSAIALAMAPLSPLASSTGSCPALQHSLSVCVLQASLPVIKKNKNPDIFKVRAISKVVLV